MARYLFICLVLIAPGLSAEPLDTSRGLLWQIDGVDGTRSHLFGTIHVGEPAVLQLPASVEDAFTKARQLVVEVIIGYQDQQEIGRRMRLYAGQNLQTMIGASLYSRVLHAAHSRGIDRQVVRMKPWAVATMLLTPTPTGLPVLDQQLQRRAQQMGKSVIALETIDEQLAIFEQMPLTVQIDLLHEAVLASLEFEVYYGELMLAYLNRDLAAMLKLSDLHLAQESRLKQALQLLLVDQRNDRMVQRLVPILQQGGVFVAVGALHLPGESGLLQQFHQRGYQLTVIY
ncbi:MAG: TraB/GumN family protein [Immundisolibacteraceae bacterium]|nr:TraB/GumN family protein [Immundisolibacteraceae bacterium]